MNQLRRFLIESAEARGDWASIDQGWQEIVGLANYPDTVRQWVGEALGAGLLLSSNLKSGGLLTLQVRGSGKIGLLVVQVGADGHYRATAEYSETPSPGESLEAVFGDGSLLINLALPGAREDYQALVPLEGNSFAAALEGYFARSEQLPTRVCLGADAQSVTAMLVQRLPESLQKDVQDWERVEALFSTLGADELNNLDVETMLHRLFHEEQVRVYDPKPLTFQCRCSRERVSAMVQNLGEEDAQALLAEQGKISVDCEFCKANYAFDSADVALLFAANPGQGSDTLQ